MSVLAIEINDAGVNAARSTEAELLVLDDGRTASPGFACVERKKIITGLVAERLSRQRPLDVDNHFWDRLDTEPVNAKDHRSPNRAEVAFAHLQHVLSAARRPDDEIVIAVPPFYDARQLGFLAGMARELGVPVPALVASPIALDYDDAANATTLVVELTLHRGVLSVVAGGDQVVLRRTQVCPGIGLDDFHRAWIRSIAGEFVRETRFDPLHDAMTEQRLYDRLPEIIGTVTAEGQIPVELEAGARTHRVLINEQLVSHASHGLIFELSTSVQSMQTADDRFTSIILSRGAAGVPGLRKMLQQQVAVPVHGLAQGATARGLARLWPTHFEHVDANGLPHHTWRHAKAIAADAATTSTAPSTP